MTNFGIAIEKLKAGAKMARAGWNGKGMWLYYVPAAEYAAQTEAARSHFGPKVPYQAYIAMKTVADTVVPWLASQSDILADDWMEFEPMPIDEKLIDTARNVLADHETYFAPKILLGDWDDSNQMKIVLAAIKAGMALAPAENTGD